MAFGPHPGTYLFWLAAKRLLESLPQCRRIGRNTQPVAFVLPPLCPGRGQSIRKTWQVEGVAGITKGWVPTFYGYGAQGTFKFGLNEFFKDLYTNLVGEQVVEDSLAARMALWAAASGSAEIFADVALCPFEMVKVRMQVALPGDAAAAVGSGMVGAMREMNANRAETKFPFGSLYPLWGRQVRQQHVNRSDVEDAVFYSYSTGTHIAGSRYRTLSGSTTALMIFRCHTL